MDIRRGSSGRIPGARRRLAGPVLLLAGFLFGGLGCGAPPSDALPDAAQPASSAAQVARTLPGPDFELLGLDGERHRLSSYRGRIVLVNYWATWCLSCRDEIPVLNRLHEEFANRGVAIVGVATDEDAETKVVPYVEKMAMAYPVLLDPQAVSASIFGGFAGYPSTFILDPQGLIYSSYLGAQEEKTFADDLRYLLQAAPSEGATLPAGAISHPVE